MPTVTLYPTSNVAETPDWTNPQNAYANDAANATATPLNGNTIANRWGGFGVDTAIPVGAAIVSVTLESEVRLQLGNTATYTWGMQPYVSGAARGTETTRTDITTAAVVMSSGALTGFTRSDLLDANFGVRVRLSRSALGARTGELNFVRIIVDYLPEQSISPPLLSATRALYAPTLEPGEVVIAPPLLSGTRAVYAPTYVGAVIEPPLLVADRRVLAPTLEPGLMTISPPLLSGTRVLYGPTLEPGLMVISPPLLVGDRQVFAPFVQGVEDVAALRKVLVRQTLSGYHGPIEEHHRLFISNALGEEIRPLPEWSGATVDMSNEADATWSLTFTGHHTDAFDPISDWILAATDVLVGGTVERFYLGLYRFLDVDYSYLEHLRTWTLAGKSGEELLARDEPSRGFLVLPGQGALVAARNVLIQGKVPASKIRFPGTGRDQPIRNGLLFDPLGDSSEMTRLAIVNEILAAGAFEPLRTDRYGNYFTREMLEVYKRAPKIHYGPESVTDAEHFVGPDATDKWSFADFANHIIVVAEDVNDDRPMYAVAENNYPASPTSIPNMGRKSRWVKLKTTASQAVLDRVARVALIKWCSVLRSGPITTLRDPRRDADETYTVDHDSEGVRVMEGRWDVDSWNYSLDGTYTPMQHNIRKTERLT